MSASRRGLHCRNGVEDSLLTAYGKRSLIDGLPARSGLMLVGHGTRDANGTREFFQLAERLRSVIAPVPLAECLLEFQEPTIDQAWQTLVDQSVHHVRVVPLLLFAAGHAKQDIPEAVAAAATKNARDVTFDQCRPISRQAAMVDWVDVRLHDAIVKVKPSPRETAVIMVGRGSYDPCAKSDMRILTEVVAHRNSGLHFETAFYAMAEPRLPDVIDQVAGMNRFASIVVQPHLLFMGRLYEAIQRQVDEARVRHPSVEFVIGDYLGPVDAVAFAIAARAGVAV